MTNTDVFAQAARILVDDFDDDKAFETLKGAWVDRTVTGHPDVEVDEDGPSSQSYSRTARDTLSWVGTYLSDAVFELLDSRGYTHAQSAHVAGMFGKKIENEWKKHVHVIAFEAEEHAIAVSSRQR